LRNRYRSERRENDAKRERPKEPNGRRGGKREMAQERRAAVVETDADVQRINDGQRDG
jgi:hypothetical protein